MPQRPNYPNHGEMTGEALIADFRTAIEVVSEITELTKVPNAIQDLNVDERNARVVALAEQMRELDLNRFIGASATFRTDQRGMGSIQKYVLASSEHDEEGIMVPVGLPMARPKEIKRPIPIMEFEPAQGLIRAGNNARQVMRRKHWVVFPFDAKSGEQVVDIRLAD